MSSSTPPSSTESEARERVAQGFQHMVEEADQLLQNARRTGQARLANARAGLVQAEEVAVAQARRAAGATDEAVRAHPYAAMGVAAGVGLLLGMLIARR